MKHEDMRMMEEERMNLVTGEDTGIFLAFSLEGQVGMTVEVIDCSHSSFSQVGSLVV